MGVVWEQVGNPQLMRVTQLNSTWGLRAPYCLTHHVAGTLEVTEAALVRDILYVFQGIDGKNIKMSSTENCYKVDAKVCSQNLRQHSETESTHSSLAAPFLRLGK